MSALIGRRPAAAIFALAVAASAAMLLVFATHLTFLLDDWAFLQYRYDPSWDAVMLPHNEHISIAPVLIYEALLHSFGMDSSTPFRAVAAVAFLAGVVLVFALVRRRVGDWLALAGTLPLLFFGAGAEDLLFPFQVGYFGSLAFGLAALLALERDDTVGDRLACASLVAGLLFSSVGLPFLVAAALCVGWDTRRWRRAYVVLIPAALYGLWWLGWGHEAQSHLTLKNVATSPSYVLDGFAASLSSLVGLAPGRVDAQVGALDWGRPLLVVAVALCAWRLVRGPRPSRWLWILLALAVAYWFLAASSAYFDARAPTAGRYQYVGAVLLVLIVAELLRGVRLSVPALVAAFALVAVSLAANLNLMRINYEATKATTELERADLAALLLARDRVAPDFQITEQNGDTSFVGVIAGDFLPPADRFGSPAYTPAELAAAPEPARVAADKVFASALRLALVPVPDATPAGGVAPSLLAPAQAALATPGSCLRLRPTGTAAIVELPTGGASIRAGDAPVTLSLRRYASTSFPVTVGEVKPGRAAELPVPTDRSGEPWELAVESAGRATVCGLGEGDR